MLPPCPKILGADFELANALVGEGPWDGWPGEAARRLLAEIPGFPLRRWSGSHVEWGRRFLPTSGGSAYIDSDHLEINLPEHTGAADHAVLIHAGLRLAHQAQQAASRDLPSGCRINVLAAVSDGRESWGSHLNVLIGRPLFDAVFRRKPQLAGFVAAHLATAQLFTGHGQVGAGNGRGACTYQLSQRADWFEEFMGTQTMTQRPLLNSRDEPHAGSNLARLHIIFFDNVLAPVANFLKAGTTQLVLALAEAGWADPDLLLDDPLVAAHEVSRDLSLRKPLALARRGRSWTAVEVQRALLELAREFIAAGGAEGVVPGAGAIADCWEQTLDLLARRELAALAGRCDWALKFLLLERQRGRRGLAWDSAEMKYLDLLFSSVDPAEGLFWQMASAGQVERMPTAGQVERCLQEPPEDTRAYLRAHVLRRFGDAVADLDWDHVRFRVSTGRYWYREATLPMPDPAGLGRKVADPLLGRCRTLDDLIETFAGLTESAPTPLLLSKTESVNTTLSERRDNHGT